MATNQMLAVPPTHCLPGEETLGEADHRLPVLDPSVLMDLGRNLDSPETALRFARDYAASWDIRRDRLLDALERGDHPTATDAVISIKVSSAMVGALRLSLLAEEIEQLVGRGDMATGYALMDAVTDCGRQTLEELQQWPT